MNISDKIIKVLQNTNDPSIQKELNNLQNIDPKDVLRESIMNFFKNRLLQIEEEKDLKNIVIQTIINKISDNELSITQLLGLLNSLQNQSQNSIESILTLFRPVPNTVSPIFDSKNKEVDTPFNNLKPEESQAISYLTKIILHQKSKESTDE